jgi:hypothetical protein
VSIILEKNYFDKRIFFLVGQANFKRPLYVVPEE